jgi:DNA adenine methylase
MNKTKTQKYSFRADPLLIENLQKKYLTDNTSEAITLAIREVLAPKPAEHIKVKPLFSILGTKSKTLASRIIKIMPEHVTYVEPFGGTGAVLLAKQESKVEVYNDLNGRLCNLFTVLKKQPLEFYLKCKELFIADSILKEQKQVIDFASPLEDAVNYFYLTATTIYGNKQSLRHQVGKNFSKTYQNRLSLITSLSERLENVSIFNRDFSYIIKKYDSPNTLFYCDPPYYSKEGYYDEVCLEQHNILGDMLRNIKGNFILSYYANTAIYNLYRSKRIYHISYRMKRKSGFSKTVTEKIITNFPFDGCKPMG